MDDVNLGFFGAKVISWRQSNYRTFVKQLMDENPGLDPRSEKFFVLFRDEITQEDNEEFHWSALRYALTNAVNAMLDDRADDDEPNDGDDGHGPHDTQHENAIDAVTLSDDEDGHTASDTHAGLAPSPSDPEDGAAGQSGSDTHTSSADRPRPPVNPPRGLEAMALARGASALRITINGKPIGKMTGAEARATGTALTLRGRLLLRLAKGVPDDRLIEECMTDGEAQRLWQQMLRRAA